MNVYETIEELFAQVSQQLQKQNTTQQLNVAIQTLKTQVICTIAIANQLPVYHIVSSLRDIAIPLHNGELQSDPA